MTDHPDPSRRGALKCLAFGGAGTLFTLSGGILTPVALTSKAFAQGAMKSAGVPLFLQISDTHIGFNKDANPDVAGTLKETIALVNGMKMQPALTIHTGDITHLSRASEFDLASHLLSDLKAGELHTVPGEHDVTDGMGSEYFARFGKASDNRGYYSFDHQGVHFIGLVNVMNFKPNGLGGFGADQLAWLKDDLSARSSSTPIVVFAHMPMWTILESWGWGTGDAEEALSYLRRFGAVTTRSCRRWKATSLSTPRAPPPIRSGRRARATGPDR
jgi:3',5'-cyclic AMP phosphodiesterase CpdA